METKLIEVNGIHLSVKEAGNGPDMVLIHGKGYSKENMDRLFNNYKDRFHVVSYDVRGHGESDKPEAFTFADDVEDLYQLTIVLGLDKPIAIGFSMGSYIALRTAEDHPGIFSKLVLIGTKPGGQSSIVTIQEEAKAKGLSAEETSKLILKCMFAPQVTFDDIKAFNKETASTVRLTAAQQDAITESMNGMELMSNIKKVEVPVLCLTGEYDGVNTPETAKQIADALPDGRLEVIPNAGHIAFFENPEKVFECIDAFA